MSEVRGVVMVPLQLHLRVRLHPIEPVPVGGRISRIPVATGLRHAVGIGVIVAAELGMELADTWDPRQLPVGDCRPYVPEMICQFVEPLSKMSRVGRVGRKVGRVRHSEERTRLGWSGWSRVNPGSFVWSVLPIGRLMQLRVIDTAWHGEVVEIRAVIIVLWQRPTWQRVMLHSDRGTQFTSEE